MVTVTMLGDERKIRRSVIPNRGLDHHDLSPRISKYPPDLHIADEAGNERERLKVVLVDMINRRFFW